LEEEIALHCGPENPLVTAPTQGCRSRQSRILRWRGMAMMGFYTSGWCREPT